MAKGMGKRSYHKQETATVNRWALWIAGGAAAVILLVMAISFLW